MKVIIKELNESECFKVLDREFMSSYNLQNDSK